MASPNKFMASEQASTWQRSRQTENHPSSNSTNWARDGSLNASSSSSIVITMMAIPQGIRMLDSSSRDQHLRVAFILFFGYPGSYVSRRLCLFWPRRPQLYIHPSIQLPAAYATPVSFSYSHFQTGTDD